jgi:sugar phosphate isomerase/epimerase
MDRRSFLGTVTAAGILSNRFALAAGKNAEKKIEKIGVQLYSVRDQMEKDFAGTIAKVAKIGYREVEFAGYFDHSPQDVRRLLDENGLTSPSAHIEYDRIVNHLPEVIAAAKVVGHTYIVCPHLDEALRNDADGWKKIAQALNKAGAEAGKSGMQIAYHNHNFEFKTFDGKPGYDILLEEADAKLVKMEMDLYWTTKAGADPLKYFAKYPGRFPLVHVKDMDQAGDFTEVGNGSIDWKAIFAKSKEAGIKHYIVEQDKSNDPFASIKTSYEYLHDLRFG